MNEPVSERAILATNQHRENMRSIDMGQGALRIYEAIAQATSEIPPVLEAKKDGPRGKYAPLEDMMRDLRHVLLKHKLLIRQGVERSYSATEGDGRVRLYAVYTDIIHWPSGEMHRTVIDMPAQRLDPQGVGSALTYGKRYGLIAALGIATSDDVTDDDGESARKRELTDKVHESHHLVALKDAIDGLEKKGDLSKLRGFKLGDARQHLSDEEFGVLRAYWTAAGERVAKGAE